MRSNLSRLRPSRVSTWKRRPSSAFCGPPHSRPAVFGGIPSEPLRHLGEAEPLALIQTRKEFAGAVWITDDRDAGEYAAARAIPVKNTVTLMREAAVSGLIHHAEGHRLLLGMVADDRHIRGVRDRAERLLD
ncbi:hypothetical protein [Streptomyces sp. NPDC057418]|uniref:hypothetical protein n=1 Tax=Streptomyces sp. NPDC057418 TaxID=3346126 RepID=UPI0036753CDD